MGTEGFRGALLATLVIVSLMVPAISLLSVSPSSAAPEGLTPRAPIYIYGNGNFIPANGVVAGSGTENDPYIIENWDINAENAHGIEIRNTTAHFVIRNCYVHDGRANHNFGIYLYNVKNGKIDNNLVKNNLEGIGLSYSDNNLVENNLVENNLDGIWLSYSDNNLVENNLVWNNVSYGIFLENSSNNLISNNIVENNDIGIRLYLYDNNNLISNNIMRNNNSWGFGLVYRSDNNLISNNIVENNGHGIYLGDSDNNLISNNIVENNGYGIFSFSYSNNNLIYHNNFINNANQATDSSSNYWDDGYPSGGNYWSDYAGPDANGDGIGDTPYDNILGGSNQDNYPLVNPWPVPHLGTATFSLKNLYTVNVEKILYLGQGSKLVVKFYTYANAFENENIIENFSPPLHVEESESARHPEDICVKKARLDLTTDNTENVISTIASFTVRKVDLEDRFMWIPFYWVIATSAGKLALETEFMRIPFCWSGAP